MAKNDTLEKHYQEIVNRMTQEDLKELIEVLQKITQAIDNLNERVAKLEGVDTNAIEKGVQ